MQTKRHARTMRTAVLVLLFAVVAANADSLSWLNSLGDDDVDKLVSTGQASPTLAKVLDQIRDYTSTWRTDTAHLIPQSNDKGVLQCTLCRNVFDTAIGWVEAGDTRDEIVDKMTVLCVQAGTTTERVCRGLIDINIDIFLWIFEERNATSTPLTAVEICGVFLYPVDCQFNEEDYVWTLDLSFVGPKPPPEIPQPPVEGSPTLKVLQFTDVHVDPNYMPGYNAECGEPMCCRFDQGLAPNASAAAGYWGDYRDCDAPVYAFQDQLQEAATRHQDVAYIIFTGDMVDHALWATSESYNADLITLVRDEFLLHFPGVPIIPILGNHEAHPCNVFTDPLKTEIPANLTSTWLYELWADIWSTWLPPATRPDILAGGMFALEIRPGLVVIGVNTMFCYSFNWWLMYDNVDPANQLTWLATQLLEVEQAGKKAHILGHHASGRPDCMHFWSSQYRRIIDRFENTIVAQFHGHTHNDHFNVFYDLADLSRPTNVAFTAGSGTPLSDRNPNYRVYVIDGEYSGSSYRVLDHETWYYNLTEANLGGPSVPPNWQLLYTFNQAYGVTSQLPVELDTLVHRMANDTQLQEMYFRYYVREGDAALAEGCDSACLQSLVCEIVTTVHKDLSKCDELFPASSRK